MGGPRGVQANYRNKDLVFHYKSYIGGIGHSVGGRSLGKMMDGVQSISTSPKPTPAPIPPGPSPSKMSCIVDGVTLAPINSCYDVDSSTDQSICGNYYENTGPLSTIPDGERNIRCSWWGECTNELDPQQICVENFMYKREFNLKCNSDICSNITSYNKAMKHCNKDSSCVCVTRYYDERDGGGYNSKNLPLIKYALGSSRATEYVDPIPSAIPPPQDLGKFYTIFIKEPSTSPLTQ